SEGLGSNGSALAYSRPRITTAMWPTIDAAAPRRISSGDSIIRRQCYKGCGCLAASYRIFLPACLLPRGRGRDLSKEIQQQPAHRLGLFLLHPVTGVLDQMA